MSDEDPPVGARIRQARERAGMSRPVLGGLVDRSADWVKAVESGRLRTPKLQILTRIARALEIPDLAELTGNGLAVSTSLFAPSSPHAALPAVRAALTEYRLAQDSRAVEVAHLAERLAVAWKVRHGSPDHRTQLGALLPDLVRDAQQAVAGRGEQRRAARRVLAGVYQLADFYVAYQPEPELVWLVADRAVTEGREADDPYVMAGGAWALVQVLRESGRWDEALQVARDASNQLEQHLGESAPQDWHGMVGALHAESALTCARQGKHGQAWYWWESAHGIARTLGQNYRHIQTSFGLPVMTANAVTLGVELRRSGEALQAARSLEPGQIASIPRRSRHLIEVARAHDQNDDRSATLSTLERAERVAPETVRFNGWVRQLTTKLVDRPPDGGSTAARRLARRVGID